MYENYSLPTVQVDIQEWLPLIRHSLGSYMENYLSPTVQVLIYGKPTRHSWGTGIRVLTPHPQFRYWYTGNYPSPKRVQVPAINGKLPLTHSLGTDIWEITAHPQFRYRYTGNYPSSGTVQVLTLAREITRPLLLISRKLPRGGTPYIRMIGVTVVFFRGWNRRFGIF